MGAPLVDLAISIVILVPMMAYYQVTPSASLAALPILVVVLALLTAGAGTLACALTVAYRDFRYVVPFMVQSWMFLSAVIYPTSIVPERYRWVLFVNPVTGLVEAFRSALLGLPLDLPNIALSAATATALFAIGVAHFGAVERSFADWS
jgi:lipopolysaccharide transport system permease protein